MCEFLNAAINTLSVAYRKWSTICKKVDYFFDVAGKVCDGLSSVVDCVLISRSVFSEFERLEYQCVNIWGVFIVFVV